MIFCDIHQMYYAEGGVCPHCQRDKTRQVDVLISDVRPRRQPINQSERQVEVMQLLQERVNQTNRLTGSHHQVEMRENKLVFLYCKMATVFTVATVSPSNDLWRSLYRTLRYDGYHDLDNEMQAIIGSMKECKGEAYSFQL